MIPHPGPLPQREKGKETAPLAGEGWGRGTEGNTPMDLRFTPEEIAFRDEVRTFFRTQIPAEIRRKVREGRKIEKADYVLSQRTLNARGWAVPHWPKEWGGQDWSPVQTYIFQEELQQAALPPLVSFNVFMVGPVIAQFGSDAQKRRFLARAANLDDWWCQGFSEPGAGSDLASLKTSAGATAIITSSTARRPGRRSASTPTGSSAWCAPTRPPSSNTASRSFSST